MSTKSVSVLTKYTKCMKNLQQQQQENRTVRQCKPCAKAGADLQVRNFLCSFFGWDCQTGGEIIVLGICSSGTFSSFSYSLSSVLGIWVVTFVIDCCCFVSSSSCCCSFFLGGVRGVFYIYGRQASRTISFAETNLLKICFPPARMKRAN